eukprot:98164-Prymnesium_polylepis.1
MHLPPLLFARSGVSPRQPFMLVSLLSGVNEPENVPSLGGALFEWSKLPNMARSSVCLVSVAPCEPISTSQDDVYWCEHLLSQEVHPREPYLGKTSRETREAEGRSATATATH